MSASAEKLKFLRDFYAQNQEESKVKIKCKNKTVCEIAANHGFTLDEAIALVGEYSNDAAANGEPDVTIGNEKYYYKELSLVW